VRHKEQQAVAMSRPYEPRELARALADGAASARFLAGLLEQRTGTCTASPDAIERAIALASEPHTVVFVAVHHGNFPTLEYFAEVLRARGRKTVAIYLQAPAPDGAFDAVLSCDGSLCPRARSISRPTGGGPSSRAGSTRSIPACVSCRRCGTG
jgi:hypothetical protein